MQLLFTGYRDFVSIRKGGLIDDACMKSGKSFLGQPALVMLAIGLCAGGAVGWWAGQGNGGAAVGAGAEQSARTRSRGGDTGESSTGERAKRSEGGRSPVKTDPKEFAESVKTILRESIPSRRVALFEQMLEKVGTKQYPELVALIRAHDLDGSGSGAEWERLWASWGERDPVGAMTYIQQKDWSGWDGSAPSEARKRTMINWGQTDPEAAKRFVLEGEDLAKGNRDMLYFMVEGWTYRDPTAAADWLIESGLGLEGEYKSVVEAISRKGGQKELEGWFAGLDRGSLSVKDRNGFAELIAGKKLEHEPEKAAAWVEANLSEPWVTESKVLGQTAAAYVRKDPEAAIAWARRTELPNAVRMTVASWCHRDMNAAKKWVADNPGDPDSAACASTVMAILRSQNPDAAQAWAESLPDKAMRDRLTNPRRTAVGN